MKEMMKKQGIKQHKIKVNNSEINKRKRKTRQSM